ncbi:hypothetical protein FSP39_017532 [Pinctada imbricata]|uniref:Mab-21-like HhH/H2TH-like domain-containing protein n=1 Tax=Pinctada imbricata TaxID=66713 RepID=A0AA88YRR3_PINIB|nr:hypothetical protein FSP39_017532 [Pinctada imbricata]
MVYLRDSKLEVLCDNRTTPLPLEQIRAEIGDTHPGYCTLRFFGKRELLLTALDIKVEGGPEYPGRAVAAYHCPTWPAVAKEWLERNSKWPTVGLKKKIEKCGCFVAKRPHAKSKNPIYEWQFIFNDAEKLLVKEGLTKSQLYVYDIFKSCLDYHSKHLQFKLGTVHVKSTFFYVCEMINDDTFEESPGVCFIYLAGTLLTNLMRRDIPNYFIRNNNMIDHFKDDDIENLIHILEAVRFFPLHSLGLMMDGRGYNRSGIIDIIQRDGESYMKKMDLNKAFCHLFFPMMIRQACKIAKTSRYRKVYEKIRDARLLLVLAPMENEKPVYVPSLGNLIKQSLKDFDDKTVDLVATEMEESINNHNSVRKIKDLTGGRDVGGFGEINIPSYILDNAYKEATILNTYGVILHNADRNYEDASTYYASALDRLECNSFEEDDSQAEGNKCSMRSPHEQFEHDGLTLKIFRNIFNSGVLEKLRPRMTFLEKVCLRMKNTEYVDFVMEAWEKLGNPDRAAEFHSSFLEHLSNT